MWNRSWKNLSIEFEFITKNRDKLKFRDTTPVIKNVKRQTFQVESRANEIYFES